MKYNLTKKISYSIIILVLLVGLSLTAIFGMNGKGYGSAKDINLGLDLRGGMNVTMEVDVADVVRNLANNTQDPVFNQAIEEAIWDNTFSDSSFDSSDE